MIEQPALLRFMNVPEVHPLLLPKLPLSIPGPPLTTAIILSLLNVVSQPALLSKKNNTGIQGLQASKPPVISEIILKQTRRRNLHQGIPVRKMPLPRQEQETLKAILLLLTVSQNPARNISIHGLRLQDQIPAHKRILQEEHIQILKEANNVTVRHRIMQLTHVSILHHQIIRAGVIHLHRGAILHLAIHHLQGHHPQAILLHPDPHLPVILHHPGRVAVQEDHQAAAVEEEEEGGNCFIRTYIFL